MTFESQTSAALAVVRRGRDHELLSYIGRQGVVAMPHVMAALGVGQTAAYDRVAVLIDAELLERVDTLRGEPSLLRATRAGLRYAHLGGFPPAVVSPGAVDHWLRCASAHLLLADRHGADRIRTEREIAFAERYEGRPIASAKIGELPDGRARLHRPDLAIVFDDRIVSVEVELTPKSPRRLREIIRGWRRASWVAEVHYLCEPGQTRSAVERAVEKLHASERIRIDEAPRRMREQSAR